MDMESWGYILFAIWMNGNATMIPLPKEVIAYNLPSEAVCERAATHMVAAATSEFKQLKRFERADFKCIVIKEEKSI